MQPIEINIFHHQNKSLEREKGSFWIFLFNEMWLDISDLSRKFYRLILVLFNPLLKKFKLTFKLPIFFFSDLKLGIVMNLLLVEVAAGGDQSSRRTDAAGAGVHGQGPVLRRAMRGEIGTG